MNRWQVSIVYDSPALPGFAAGWGFSALISSRDGIVLFDCGWDGHLLRDNLSALGCDVSDIQTVVLSHPHWDHITGLPEVLRSSSVNRPLEVIVPDGFSKNLIKEIGRRAAVKEVSKAQEVLPGMWATGPLGGGVVEQALVLRGETGVAVLTGCGHPGLDAILAAGSSLGPPRLLAGGLHDCTLPELERSLREHRGLQAALFHCTRCKAEASSALPDRVRTGAAGETFEVEL